MSKLMMMRSDHKPPLARSLLAFEIAVFFNILQMPFEPHQKLVYDLGVRVESSKKRGELKIFESARKSDASTPVAERRNIENITVKKSAQDTSNVLKGQTHCIVRGEDIFHERDMKRQKKLNYGLSEMSLESHGQILQRCTSSDSSSNLEYKICVAQPKAVIDQHPMKESVCGFCHSPKTTEKTGPFLYYANGREVVGNVTSLSKVICVHSKCIEWTPQVYYEGDIIKNLDTELARAAKLKCSSCGMKGAALGCYLKSCRRSYHVPCAFEIQDCRWDMENFVMMCPIHKSVKFPSEKSKSRKHVRREMHPETSPPTTEQLKFWARSLDGPKEWVLCGSALSSEEKLSHMENCHWHVFRKKTCVYFSSGILEESTYYGRGRMYMLVKFANMCGATVCKFWKPNVTHVVATTDEKGSCTRTMKVLMAISSGKWILTMDWVKACIAANGPVNEEPYEISLDNYGCSGGPKAGRLRASTDAPKLFEGFNFYLSENFMPAYKSDLLDLVEKAGGTIIQSKELLVKQTHAALETWPPSLVVYNCDPPQGCMFEEESSILQQRLAEAEDLAKQIGCQVIQHTWILESIAACKLVPFF
ncbi:hypothetical protein HAX54_029551 [Datura stramonium]|uniref:Uncharacterized protein n=1 Tax=Datura stramonium TaxID=4076 RepID=A0ABS8SAB3_DATST|nr:hypothetical protein [Datura stramonium]